MEDNYNGYLIFFIILSIVFGIIAGISKCSFWWGIGTTIGMFILSHLAYFFGLILDGIEYNRQHKDDDEDYDEE